MPELLSIPATVETSFRAAMRRCAATVTIITAQEGDTHYGVTATAVTSVSMEPPSIMVCLNRDAFLHDIMLRAPRFCVNVLRSSQTDLSRAFSGAVPRERRFEVGNWLYTDEGLPYLGDAQASIFCRKVAAVPYGTHTMFVGGVDDVSVYDAVEPLIYQNAGYCVAAQLA
ncbi:flavin reductase family protein [Rhizobium leguminosarum]|uniref:flavin reductase family protein n=1 Tax=Rhizobium leguminosarum TaxID=384 RepID=UPI003F96DAC4